MNIEQAEVETREIFGPDSFTETDEAYANGQTRYYVGACPTVPGEYRGFMGFSWEEALGFARGAEVKK